MFLVVSGAEEEHGPWVIFIDLGRAEYIAVDETDRYGRLEGGLTRQLSPDARVVISSSNEFCHQQEDRLCEMKKS